MNSSSNNDKSSSSISILWMEPSTIQSTLWRISVARPLCRRFGALRVQYFTSVRGGMDRCLSRCKPPV